MNPISNDMPENETVEDEVVETHDQSGEEVEDGEELEEGATFLAVFTGTKDSVRMTEWMAMPEDERNAKQQEGIAAWKDWMAEHEDLIVDVGGPLGKTKSVSPDGIADISNNLSGFVVLYADSHEEAAEMFRDHPHFTLFPGASVEIMPILPIPGEE